EEAREDEAHDAGVETDHRRAFYSPVQVKSERVIAFAAMSPQDVWVPPMLKADLMQVIQAVDARADFSTEPALRERQKRLQKIVAWILVSALALLVVAALCAAFRH